MEEDIYTEKKFFVRLDLAIGNLNTIYGTMNAEKQIEYLNKAKNIIDELIEKLN